MISEMIAAMLYNGITVLSRSTEGRGTERVKRKKEKSQGEKACSVIGWRQTAAYIGNGR